MPPGCAQASLRPPVPPDITRNLPLPILDIGTRHPAARTSMPMPEASVHKHRQVQVRNYEIRMPWQILAVRRKPASRGTQRRSHRLLRPGATPEHLRHDPTSLSGIESIGHLLHTRTPHPHLVLSSRYDTSIPLIDGLCGEQGSDSVCEGQPTRLCQTNQQQSGSRLQPQTPVHPRQDSQARFAASHEYL